MGPKLIYTSSQKPDSILYPASGGFLPFVSIPSVSKSP